MDLLSHEYGWTTEYILSRTFLEIEYRLYAINRRNTIDQANKIALAGGRPKMAIPKRRVDLNENKEKTKEENEIDKKIMNAFNQRQKEWPIK